MGKKSRSKAAAAALVAEAEALIVSTLQEDQRRYIPQKDLVKILQTRHDVKKKTATKAIQGLLDKQRIHGRKKMNSSNDDDDDDDTLLIELAVSTSTDNFQSESNNGAKVLTNKSLPEESVMPIGMLLRTNKRESQFPKTQLQQQEQETSVPGDIDEEIARLERELANSQSSDTEDEEDDTEEDDTNDSKKQELKQKRMKLVSLPTATGDVKDQQPPAVLSLSKYSNDRVEHLPLNALPVPGRYKPNVVSADSKALKKKSKKRPRNEESTTIQPSKNSGLQQAVQEVLTGYQARSSEKIPFYCRFCATQYANATEFFDHKDTDFHKTAVQAERRLTYCKLCRLQLTSPIQMKEHLQSRPHKHRLQTIKSRQVMHEHKH